MVDPLLLSETFRVEKFAGIVPVPVAAMIAGSACWSSHSIVSPSDLWPNSLVAGIRILRPRPSTLVCRSLVDLLGAAVVVTTFLEGSVVDSDLVAIAREASMSCAGGALEEVEALVEAVLGDKEGDPLAPPVVLVDRPAWMEMEPMNGADRPSKGSGATRCCCDWRWWRWPRWWGCDLVALVPY
ncbi:hypothetical protein RJ639_037576 [Escallonia herrerae]|uniref:Uncharacterized protein n=1 Tax=Escallonia herrerae TaxID=1293975 RepID=A0AA88WIH0_9ASTE|nr:hypothetical protein RJ639_037576 [Escallonia herrerae]